VKDREDTPIGKRRSAKKPGNQMAGYVTDDLYVRIRRYIFDHEVSKTWIINKAIEEFLDREDAKKAHSKVKGK